MKSYQLDVIAVYFNPLRWKSRRRLFLKFIQHMLDSGVRLTVVECAFGSRPFEIRPRRGVNLVRVRSKSVVWNKECLINIGISRLPRDWRYVCWADGDLRFRHPEWASEAVHALQQYQVIQPWAHCYDLGPNGEHVQLHHSYCKQYRGADVPGFVKGSEGTALGHPGYVWCMTREAAESTNGLIETAPVGAGDRHMALALVGAAKSSFPSGVSEGYAGPILQWERRALHHVQESIVYLPHTIEHFWHGPKPKRRYIERWDIIIKHQFDPFEDLKRNVFGVLELAGNKPDLTRAIDTYFLMRDEDSNEWDYFSS